MKKKTIIVSILLIITLTVGFLYLMYALINGEQNYKIKKGFTSMDTYIEIQIEGKDQNQLNIEVNNVKEIYDKYNKIADRYKDYEGVNNVKMINDNAGIKPIKVSEELFKLIKYSKDAYALTNNYLNIASGSVLEIWHLKREEGINIPTLEQLSEAKLHTDINDLILDETNLTVYLNDPQMSLDLGAVAKGYTTEIAGKYLEKINLNKYLINAGGNIKVGEPLASRTKWNIGVRDPLDDSKSFTVLSLENEAVVTSGDYQRTFVVDGIYYHHIIDLNTLYPSRNFKSVTIITKDSGYADILSTALFLMTLEEGQKYVESLEGVEVIWYDINSKITYSKGAKKYVQENN